MDKTKISKGVRLILEGIGEDPGRPGLVDTPRRYADFCSEVFSGLGTDAHSVIKPMEGEKHNEMVILKDLSFFSFCEHHILPFLGKAHIANEDWQAAQRAYERGLQAARANGDQQAVKEMSVFLKRLAKREGL